MIGNIVFAIFFLGVIYLLACALPYRRQGYQPKPLSGPLGVPPNQGTSGKRDLVRVVVVTPIDKDPRVIGDGAWTATQARYPTVRRTRETEPKGA